MCWIWLSLAIVLEVSATVSMKLSNGFTRVVPTVSMFVLYGLSLVPMVAALKQMEVCADYAIWSAVGTALVATLGIFLFDEPASMLKVGSIGLIIVGVVCLNLSMRQSSLPSRAGRNRTMAGSPMKPQPPREGHDIAAVLASQQTTEASLR